jgi:hypothetical protein
MTTTYTTRLLGRLLLVASSLLACVAGGAVVTPVGSAADRLARLTKAPPARTARSVAQFRFTSRARDTQCRRDAQRYRPCRSVVTYRGLGSGRHRFVLRARDRDRTVFVHRSWTVVRAGAHRPASSAEQAEGAGSAGGSLMFADEFDGSGAVDTSRWALYDSPGNAGFGLRRPSAFTLDGRGNLVVTARMAGDEIVSGGMASQLNFTYGRVEFRVRTEPDPTGTMSAVVLTWPKRQNAPDFTENDMYETGPVADNTRQFESFVHFGPPELGRQRWRTYALDPSRWHTVAMDWDPGRLQIFVDGDPAWSVTDPEAIADVAHHVCVQLDARADRRLERPVRMYVDYVRVYRSAATVA